MKLFLFVTYLVVSILVCVTSAKRHSGQKVKALKSDSSNIVPKLKLPGRTVVVPAKKEQITTTAVKSLRTFGSK